MNVRLLAPNDSIAEITVLVRTAYKQLADLGFRYWGTWQSEEDTAKRCSEGHCLVAEHEGRIVGTVTVKQCRDQDDPEWYLQDDVWVATQFAVLPQLQNSGLGSRLLEEAERIAFTLGGREAAIDTAEGARRLIAYYAKRGYRHVGKVDWQGTNYVSVIMSKRLRPVLETTRLVLRELKTSDQETVQAWWADERFASRYPPGRLTPEHCRETFEFDRTTYPRPTHCWAVTMDGQIVGRVRMTMERSATGQLGYEVAPDRWGQGIVTEAVREVVRYGFEELRLHRIQAWIYENNTASLRVAEKLGFVFEGALREKIRWADRRVDDLVFGLLRSEWEHSF